MVSRGRQSAMEVLLAATIVLLLNGMTYVDARAVGCGGKPADVVFMLDASNSIWGPDFRKQLHFVKDVIDWFTIGHNEMRVSVITYADYPQLQFHLHYYFTKDQLSAAVDNIRQNGGYHTITADALRYARQNVLGGRGDHVRENVTKVVVVITDGLSDNRTATALEAARTKEAGIHVFAVGVGKEVDLEELDTIASQPSMYYTFRVDGYEGLSNIRELLAIKTCTVTDPPTTTTTTTTPTPTSTTTTSATTPTSTNGMDAFSTESPDATGNVSDRDPDGSEVEKLRTPVILQPPTFQPFDTEKPVAELKGPDQTNCTLSTEVRENGTKFDGKNESDREHQVIEDPKRPCVTAGDDGTDPGKSGKPAAGLNRSDSEDGSRKGRGKDYWLYNEHGYMIGSRFVKLKNRTTDVNGSDAPTLTEEPPSVVDTGVTLPEEDGVKNISFEERPSKPGDEIEVYFSSYPWGRGGYWYRDEILGYVWYRYISPGLFELDLDTTYKVRGASEAALESANREKVVSAPSLLSGDATSPKMSESSASEDQNREADDTASVQSTTQVPSGYWDLDEQGRYVWYRYVAGVYQRLYPVTMTEADHVSTLPTGDQPSMATEAPAAAVNLPHTVRSQTAKEEQESSSTEDGRNSGQAPGAIEFDFWRFVKGKRVSFQYVPPNDLDENDEESRLASQREFAGAVDVPSGESSNSDGTGRDFRYSEEKRRVWHSSNNLKSGSISTEEIVLGTKDKDANGSTSIRLDDERGRELWQQLVNLTGDKLDHSKFPSEMKSRFEMIRDKFPEKQEGDSSEKTSDHFHESYWFTDDAGQRFQVIHKYNKSDSDEPRKALQGSSDLDLMVGQFPVGRVEDKRDRWEEEENEEHGIHVPEADGTLEYEKYGSEYWIRVISSSKDAPPRKAIDPLNHAQQLRARPSFPPPRYITTGPLPPQELRASAERIKGDETQKPDNTGRKQAKGKGAQISAKKNTKQKELRVSGKKAATTKASVKGCRSRKPLDVTIAIARRANRTSHADDMVKIAQSFVTHLNKTSAEALVKFYPEIQQHSLEPGHIAKAEDLTLTNEPPALTLSSISKTLKKNAAESKRAGKKRPRQIIIYMTDGRTVVERQPKRKPLLTKIGRDVELYVVGLGEEINSEDLEAIVKLSPSTGKTRVIEKLNPHSSAFNLNDISEELLSAVCGA